MIKNLVKIVISSLFLGGLFVLSHYFFIIKGLDQNVSNKLGIFGLHYTNVFWLTTLLSLVIILISDLVLKNHFQKKSLVGLSLVPEKIAGLFAILILSTFTLSIGYGKVKLIDKEQRIMSMIERRDESTCKYILDTIKDLNNIDLNSQIAERTPCKDVLIFLSHSSSYYIRGKVVQNKNIPIDILKSMTYDEVSAVRVAAMYTLSRK